MNAQPTGFRQGGNSIRGFSLVELLAVMAVIALMMALLMPAISGWSGTAGRRGAVNVVMNTLEQARVAALESGRSVYVVFWRPEFPERDAIMVLRESEEDPSTFEQISRWLRLPEGVLFHKPEVGANVFAEDLPSGLDATIQELPGEPAVAEVGVLVFNPSGRVVHPSSSINCMVILSEGVRGEGGTEALISEDREQAGGFEIIVLSRATGRGQLVVSQIQPLLDSTN